MTLILTGVGTILAVCTTIWQLENFRKRAIKPPGTRNVGVRQSTEDAIRLDTLKSLALGVNPELRGAALKILSERALKENTFSYVLDQAASNDSNKSLMALKVLGVLNQNVSAKRLIQPRIFNVLVGILQRVAESDYRAHDPTWKRCEREAIALLSRLVSYSDECQMYAIQAGLIEWIKRSQVPGYPNLMFAVFDMERTEPIDPNLYDLLSALCDEGTVGRDCLLESGLVRDMTVRPSHRPDWVEVVIAADETNQSLAGGQSREASAIPPHSGNPLRDLSWREMISEARV